MGTPTPPNYGQRIANVINICLASIVIFLALIAIFGPPEEGSKSASILGTVLASFAFIAGLFNKSSIEDFLNRTIQYLQRAKTKLPRRLKFGLIISITINIILILGLILLAVGQWKPRVFTPAVCSSGFCVSQKPDGELIGISDGRAAFDLVRDDRELKTKASDALFKGDENTAGQDWDNATQLYDPNDAESLIYREDSTIVARQPYITIIVVTMLTGDPTSIDLGRAVLQGAYMIQREVNACSLAVKSCQTLPNGEKVRLLIANVGDQSMFATEVANEIIQFAQADKTFVGVMGWPSSTDSTKEAIDILTQHGIPMVSPTATSDDLSPPVSTPFLFRVCPTNRDNALVAAQYAKSVLNAQSAAVFFDPSFSYSKNLAEDFLQSFSGNTHALSYTRGDSKSLSKSLGSALQFNPDLIYFAGYPNDLSVLLNDSRLTSRQKSHLHVMGGSALYILGGYTTRTYKQLYFTAPAYPDEWGYLGSKNTSLVDKYNREYQSDFDAFGLRSGYGYIRSDGYSMLSYDAMLALLEASRRVPNAKTLDDIQQALAGIGSQSPAIQGVSGQISFSTADQSATGSSVNKTILMLCVVGDGTTHLDEIQGQIAVDNQIKIPTGRLSPNYCNPNEF